MHIDVDGVSGECFLYYCLIIRVKVGSAIGEDHFLISKVKYNMLSVSGLMRVPKNSP